MLESQAVLGEMMTRTTVDLMERCLACEADFGAVADAMRTAANTREAGRITVRAIEFHRLLGP
jgi:hypothetical protein